MNSKHLGFKLSLYLNYFVFAILLNSVGIVILKSINNFGVDEVQASWLEFCKDMPIAIVSFFIASSLPRIGYKKSMLIGLGIVTAASILMYFGNSFPTALLLFVLVGASFALIKVSVYSSIGLVTSTESEHNSLMSSIEGVFMFGIALAFFLFPAFNNEADPDSWLRVYWVLAGMSAISFIFLWATKFDEGDEIPGVDVWDAFSEMFRLLAKILVIVFVVSAFLFVMIEQGIMTWLPTFNERVLDFSKSLSEQEIENISINMSAILVISLGVGRILAGIIAKKVSWFWIVAICILLSMSVVVFILPKVISADAVAISSFSDIPLMAYTFPLVGLFLAPIYPLFNSAVLSALPKKLHSPMTGLIVVFSALGGTLGSRAIGYLFKTVGADTAFYYTLIPMALLLVALFMLKRLTDAEKV